MKRIFALFLALVMIFAMIPAMGTTAKAATGSVSAKPFYGLTWDEVDRSSFGNLENAPVMSVSVSNGVVTLSGSSNFTTYAQSMKTKLDALPEGMRYIRIFKTLNALTVAEDVIYADDGVAQLKALVTQFIEAYYAVGGKLDGIILDTEYTAMHNWYIYRDVYYGNPDEGEVTNTNIYADIYNNPKFETEVRPLLEERGFVFHTPEPEHSKPERRSELFSIWPNQYLGTFKTAYGNCQSIWNKVMANRISAYMTEAVYDPMSVRYPNATVSDYVVSETATWLNSLSNDGSMGIYSGNSWMTGNTSNYNMYNSGPSSDFFKDDDGNYLYKNIQSHNEAVYADNAFNSLMFNVNKMRSAYGAADTKNISVWVAEYDYNGRENSVKNSPYYTEYLYHVGLLDPKPFLVYMYRGASNFKGDEGLVVYNQRMEVISQALDELTRVVGYSDRKPIELPQTWNDSFMLSGMYANGRNVWRLTPDVTGNMTLDAFKVDGADPTFAIDGNTVTFPGGKILADATIDDVGSCGYWIETAADVQPVITHEADRYVKYPAYQENFDYADGTIFNATNAKDAQGWEASADLLVEGGALALTGTADLNNVKIPKNITAGDSYAQKQVWEVSVTLPTKMSTSTSQYVTLLSAGDSDGFQIKANTVYYSQKNSVIGYEYGSYKSMSVTLTAGQKYTLRREMDFVANTCTYSVLDANGNLVKQVKDVAIITLTTPVSSINNTSKSMSTKVLVDDYKLYTNGLEHTIKYYDGHTGVIQTATEQLTNKEVAYRLSWMNATSAEARGHLRVARYDNSGNLVSDTLLKNIEMKPGWDGIEAGVLENSGKLTVYLQVCDAETELQNKKDSACGVDGYTGDLVCKECGEILEEGETIAAAAHTKVKIPGKAATCTKDGLTVGYECSVCGEVLTPQVVTPAKGHTEVVTAAGYPATCTTAGKTDKTKCTTCGAITNAETIPALGHTAGDPVKENVVENSCTEGGSYDMVVRCTTCDGELSRESFTVEAVGHTEVILPAKDVTCTEDGMTEGRYCSTCGEVFATQTVIPAQGHIASDPVKENETATSYERVVYCSVCGVELSRETVNVMSATVTLWGAAVTVDTDQYTTDIPEAYYWINNGADAPAVTTADAEWNYSFTIIDGIPTVTLRDAVYTYTRTFLEAKFDGSLKLAYEGTNNITAPYSSSETRYFLSYASATNAAGKGKLYITGTQNAVLNVNGGDNGASLLTVSNKAYLTISGGTFNIQKTNAGGVYAVIGAGYCKTTIENCNLTVKNNDGVGGKHPVFTAGYSSYGITINNAKVTIESNAHISFCAGVFQSNMKGVLYPTTVTITGDSVVKIVNSSNSSSYDYSGVGIYAKDVTVKGGYVEISGKQKAVQTTSGNAPILTSYAGEYEMFTTKGGEAVAEYTQTTYFKVRLACDHTNTTTEKIVIEATCTTAGSETTIVTCACGEVISNETVATPALGHTEEVIPGKDATCTEPGLTEGKKCTVCGEIIVAQTEIPALGHTEEIIPGKEATATEPGLTEGKKCSVCGEILVAQEEIPATGPAVADHPVASLEDGTKVVWDLGTAQKITRVYVFYVDGQEIADIQNWNQLKNAAANLAEPYGGTYLDCNTAAKWNSIDLPKNGTYVLRVAYTDANGASKTLSLQVDVTVERVPVVTLEGTKLVFNDNYGSTPLTETYIFWFGETEVADIQNWSELQSTAKALADSPYALNDGFKKIKGKPENFLISKSGEHVIRMIYTDANGVEQRLSQALSVPYVPTATVDETDVIIDNNNGITPVDKVFVYYVGETVIKDLNDYKELQAAGSQYPDINTDGYYTDYSGDEVYNISVPVKGNYVLRIQYKDTEDGNASKAVSQQLRVDFTVSVVNGKLRFDAMADVTLKKVHLFYVGDSEIQNVQDWDELKEVGKNYSYVNGVNVNGVNGVKSFPTAATPLDSIKPVISGNYVVRVEYQIAGNVKDNGTQITSTLSKRFALEKGPEVTLTDGKLTVKAGEYTVDTITAFYVGDQTVANPTFNNLKKAAANIEGSPYGETGYKAMVGSDAIAAETLTVPGNYVLRVSYMTADGTAYMMVVELTV